VSGERKRLLKLVLRSLPRERVSRANGRLEVQIVTKTVNAVPVEVWSDLAGLTDVELLGLLSPDERAAEESRLEAAE
jgi:hypothetical protein